MPEKRQAKTPNKPDRPIDRNPTGTPERSSSSATEGNRFHFRCADTGLSCDFETDANSEQEIMHKVQEHGREAHNITAMDEETKRRVQQAIHPRAA
jgi:predicted small metal-binding protein